MKQDVDCIARAVPIRNLATVVDVSKRMVVLIMASALLRFAVKERAMFIVASALNCHVRC